MLFYDGEVIEGKDGETVIVTVFLRRQGYRSVKIGFPQRRTDPKRNGFSTAPRLSQRKTLRAGGLQKAIFPQRQSDSKEAEDDARNDQTTDIALVLS